MRAALRTLYAARSGRYVVGNEAADADSVISAIAWGLAFGLQPVVGCTSTDLLLRRDVLAVLSMCSIEPTDLMCMDTVPDPAIDVTERWTLVDHCAWDKQARACPEHIDTIIDHHHDHGAHPLVVPPADFKPTAAGLALDQAVPCAEAVAAAGHGRCAVFDAAHNASVASTCTLVAAGIQAAAPEVWDLPYGFDLARALLTVMQVDARFGSPGSKATAADEQVASQLASIVWPGEERGVDGAAWWQPAVQKCADAVLATKFEKSWWRTLQPQDALRVDAKIFAGSGGARLYTAAVLLDVTELNLPSLAEAAKLFCKKYNCCGVLCLTMEVEPAMRRGLALITPTAGAQKHRQLAALAENADLLGLTVLSKQSVATAGVDMTVWRQGNAKPSRKQVVPLLMPAL